MSGSILTFSSVEKAVRTESSTIRKLSSILRKTVPNFTNFWAFTDSTFDVSLTFRLADLFEVVRLSEIGKTWIKLSSLQSKTNAVMSLCLSFECTFFARFIVLFNSFNQGKIQQKHVLKSLNVIKEMVSVQHCNYRVMDALGRFARHSES